MTPKRIEAMLFVANKRENRERLMDLTIGQHSAHPDKDATPKLRKELEK